MPQVSLASLPGLQSARLGADRPVMTQDGVTLNWGELELRSNRRAHLLRERGVGKGDLVTLALPNGFAFVESAFALWKLGATPHIVSPRLPVAELGAILELAQPRLVISSDPDTVARTGGLAADFMPDGISRAPLPEMVSPRWKAMSSGGSTGRPKIIVAPGTSIVDADAPNMLHLPGEGAILSTGPLYHNMPFVTLIRSLARGLEVVSMARFDAEEALRLIDRHKIDWAYFVPTMMLRIARLPAAIRARYDLSSLEAVWHWAAPMPPALKDQWIEWLGAERIWELYGGTEGIATTIISGVEWKAHRGSVGRPYGNAIRILDPDGKAVAPNTVGEIYSLPDSGPATTYTYLGAERRTRDGLWDSLGDQGWMDEDGYLYIADRRTDLILSGGANIYPAEVEAALMAHPAVEGAVVIGLPHEDLGASVHAIVKSVRSDLTAAELLEFLAERLVRYKHPRSFEFVDFDLRDDAGKVRRQQLRAERIIGHS
jgi:bile acid-coenzyme A ligase